MKFIKTALTGALIFGSLAGCAGPGSYTNSFTTNNAPQKAYPTVGYTSRGYFADQLVLAMRDKLPGMTAQEGVGEITILVDSRMQVLPRSKKEMSPVAQTVTLQVIRTEDQEIIYSLVKQYAVVISAGKRGSVNIQTEGWVDMASAELATLVGQAIGVE